MINRLDERRQDANDANDNARILSESGRERERERERESEESKEINSSLRSLTREGHKWQIEFQPMAIISRSIGDDFANHHRVSCLRIRKDEMFVERFI